MSSWNSTSALTAVQGGRPTFDRADYVFQIDPAQAPSRAMLGELYTEMLAGWQPEIAAGESPQRYVAKWERNGLPSFRALLERQLATVLRLDPSVWSIIAVTSGTNAIRAIIKAILGTPRERTEILMPAITAVSTAEAILMEGYHPVLVDVDPATWMMNLSVAERSLTEQTAAILSVDWLGTTIDKSAVRRFSHQHNLPWISDSAQSFGVEPENDSSSSFADATLYSTGHPKVFHTGGSGGIIVVPRQVLTKFEEDPTGILRHEILAEINAASGLDLLREFPEQLSQRREIGELYRDHLGGIAGIEFQKTGGLLYTNCYQMSVQVEESAFGMTAMELCEALKRENIQASDQRVKSIDQITRLSRAVIVREPLTVSHRLSSTSMTLPISNHLSPDSCKKICDAVLRIHANASTVRALLRAPQIPERSNPSNGAEPRTAEMIAEQCAEYWNIGVLASNSPGEAQHILLPPRDLQAGGGTIDAVVAAVQFRPTAPVGEVMTADLRILARLPEGDIILGNAARPNDISAALQADVKNMGDGGSSASVRLVMGEDERLAVCKYCDHDGIDGNGKPWLRRQIQFFQNRHVQELRDLFVHPTLTFEEGDRVGVMMPYAHGVSLAEHVFRGAGSELVITLLERVLGKVVTDLWLAERSASPADFVQQAHLERIARRVRIAAQGSQALRTLLTKEKIRFNGESLLNIDPLLERLGTSPFLARINPIELSLIHGDMTIHNILCLDSGTPEHPFVLIDPRGVPLLRDQASRQGVELGDFAYDLAKVRLSLSAFSAIRWDLYSLEGSAEEGWYRFDVLPHPAIRTLDECHNRFGPTALSHAFTDALAARSDDLVFERWYPRVVLGEAAHCLSDSACALGRNRPDEVLPLFLQGLYQLNQFYREYSQ